MTKQTKIIIGVLAGLLGLCLIACVAVFLFLRVAGPRVAQTIEKSVVSEPGNVPATASEIADFSLPAGYSPLTSINLLGIKMAMYDGGGADHFLAILQLPNQGEINDTSIQEMEQALSQGSSRNLSNLNTVNQQDLTIRGQPAKLIVQEGTNSDGSSFRQVLVAFQGKGGPALMAVMGPTAGWDQAQVDSLVQSIR